MALLVGERTHSLTSMFLPQGSTVGSNALGHLTLHPDAQLHIVP
jgi:hypothetical protein